VIELRHPVGELIRLQFGIYSLPLNTQGGVPLPGFSPVCRIRRQSDGRWFNGSIVAPTDPFVVPVFDNPMLPFGPDLDGIYYFDFPQSRDTQGLADYTVRMHEDTVPALEDLILRIGPEVSAVAKGECVLMGTIRDALQNPRRGAAVKATVIPITTISPLVGVSLDEMEVFTGELGNFAMSLIRGLKVRLEIPVIGYDKRVTIPNAATVDFTTL